MKYSPILAALGFLLVLAACSSGPVSPSPEAAQTASAPAEPTPEATSAPSPAPVPEAPEDAEEALAEPTEAPKRIPGPILNDERFCPSGNTGEPAVLQEGLYRWNGYTYYFYEDGVVAANTVLSLEDGDYAFDEWGRWLSPLRMAVEASATAEITDQIVLAVDHALTLWNKAGDGSWRQMMEAYCGYGKNGLVLGEERIMGSKTTPIGSFPLTLAFGTGESANTKMTYRQITENSYWSEAEDESFNTWVESETPVPGEHLIDYYQYKYAVNIGFNLEDMVYSRGSAIFLHCKSNDHWDTAGCVSLTEHDMVTLLAYLRDGAYMIIVPDLESIADY